MYRANHRKCYCERKHRVILPFFSKLQRSLEKKGRIRKIYFTQELPEELEFIPAPP